MALLGPVMMGSQIFRGLEKAGYFHKYATALNQPWAIYTVLIITTTVLAFLFVSTAGQTAFGPAKTTPSEKTNLMVYTLVPLVVFFELGFHFERFISRGGQVLPTLGRQLGFDWGFLGLSIGPWLIKIQQLVFILVGVFAAKALLKKLLGSRQDTPIERLSFRQQWPIWLLAVVYGWLFLAG